ncbi:MAG: hypothetical protein ACI9R3_003988 [Verrucomicrobiales bacterium]|jgi:uncharacterized protein YbbC (DUF1343 family)/CubicO group peptidase (beta-lactamase class C family)
MTITGAQDTLHVAHRFDTGALEKLGATIESAIARKKLPGGVLWLEHRGTTHTAAFGNRSLVPQKEAMTEDTIFDAASLTKVIATTPSIMKLAELGKIRLDALVATYLPEFVGLHRERITLRHLLTHTSGLAPVVPRDFEWDGYATGIKLAMAEPLRSFPGTEWRYSDINFILLGEIVRRASGKPLEQFSREQIFTPLGMSDSGFLPPESKLSRIAPTTLMEDGQPLRGIVHDPISQRMGGTTGHAGLFTTASDLAKFARMMLAKGSLPNGHRLFAAETVTEMTTVQTSSHIEARRGLGWDIDSRYSGPRGAFPRGSFGHTGWTGTSIWMDPYSQTFLILVSNRNHPTEAGSVLTLRHALANRIPDVIPEFDFKNVVGSLAALDEVETRRLLARFKDNIPKGQALNGIDVLLAEDFASLKGKSIGLITNHTGQSRDGLTTIDLLHEASAVQLQALFSPEHGIRGKKDEAVGDGRDNKTGLPVYSLYQSNRRKPSPEQLKGLDALVFDIQDIGCRFYTYISTMGLAMEAAAENGLPFYVLDRVNPINGVTVDGPMRDGESSFTAFHPIPVRHGMTTGELAKMFNAERLDGKLELHIVQVKNWNRAQFHDETGLPWINPSPNMRSLEAAVLYPGVGLPEFTNLSVGRGTRIPFELVGAPYIDPKPFAKALNQMNIAGVEFLPVHFTPDASKFKDERCGGIKILLHDRAKCPSTSIGIALAKVLHTQYSKAWQTSKFNTLLAHPATVEAVMAGNDLPSIQRLWDSGRNEFLERRKEFLLY